MKMKMTKRIFNHVTSVAKSMLKILMNTKVTHPGRLRNRFKNLVIFLVFVVLP